MSAFLGLAAIGVLLSYVPAPSVPIAAAPPRALQNTKIIFNDLWKNKEFVYASLGVLILHATLTALFLKMPHQHWFFYLSILLLALGVTVFFILYSEKNKSAVFTRKLLRIHIVFLIVAECLLFYCIAWPPESGAWITWALGAGLFFSAFNFLEASLPSMVSKCVAVQVRGTALGIFSAAQFLGLFLGGLIAGWLDSMYGVVAVYGFCVILAVVWLRLI
jgi:membrane-associated HD superfamily phosphohydrolase